MANLIITILGIVLAVIATVIGITYLSPAFDANLAKTRAQRLLNDAQQIATAWQLYANDRNGNYTLTSTSGWTSGNANGLMPIYMSSLPRYNFATLRNGYPMPIKLTSTGNAGIGALYSTAIEVAEIPLDVCQQVNLIAKGTTTTITSTQNLSVTNPANCFIYGSTYFFN